MEWWFCCVRFYDKSRRTGFSRAPSATKKSKSQCSWCLVLGSPKGRMLPVFLRFCLLKPTFENPQVDTAFSRAKRKKKLGLFFCWCSFSTRTILSRGKISHDEKVPFGKKWPGVCNFHGANVNADAALSSSCSRADCGEWHRPQNLAALRAAKLGDGKRSDVESNLLKLTKVCWLLGLSDFSQFWGFRGESRSRGASFRSSRSIVLDVVEFGVGVMKFCRF